MQKKQLNLTDAIMNQITSGKVKMKPRWYFVLGSLETITGLSGILIFSTSLVSLISFFLRTHRPIGTIHYQQLFYLFPWWSILVIVVGFGTGIVLLKQYDLSYKKNFGLILSGILLVIVVSGWLIDATGLNMLQR